MNARIRFALILAAPLLLALAACQPEQEAGGLAVAPANGEVSTELRLVVKDSVACLELRDAVKAGADSLRAAFLATCVVEVPPTQSLPPRPVPPELRCAWAQAQIDSGRVGLVPAFARHCVDICDSLAALPDTAVFAKYCVAPPRPPRPPHDSVKPPRPPRLDSAARAAACDSLKTVLAATDSASADFPRIAHQTAAVCKLPPPRPPRPVPPPRPPVDSAKAPAPAAAGKK